MPEDLGKFQEKLGYQFKNMTLLQQALDRHACYSENGAESREFEQLEFVGDRVLNLCIADTLTQLHPSWAAKELSPVYIHYTRNTNDEAQHGGPLYRIAKVLQLEKYLILPPGMQIDKAGKRGKTKQKGEKTKEWKLSDHMEALFGAIYRDSNFETTAGIIKYWFDHLGLLEADHHSVTSFGESQSVISELSIVKSEHEAGYSQFIEFIARGNLIKLQQLAFTSNNKKQLVYALLVALSNNRTNVISFLMTQYPYDLETVREALEDTSIAISSRSYLEVILLHKLIDAFQNNTLDELGKAELFLGLVQHSAMQTLETLAMTVSDETLQASVRSALEANNTNIICFLVKKYVFPVEFLQDIANTEEIAVDLRNFLHKHINKRNNNTVLLSHHVNNVWNENTSSTNSTKTTSNNSSSPKKGLIG